MNLKKLAKKLYERFKAGIAGGVQEEVDIAKKLFDDLCKKEGWSESDFEASSEFQIKIDSLEFVPDIDYKTNPDWFIILFGLISNHFNCKVVTFFDRLGCLLCGESEDTAKLKKELEFAIDRSKTTYKLICKRVSGKKPNKDSYMHGFAVGFNQAVIEEQLEKQNSEFAKLHKGDARQSLLVISQKLSIIDMIKSRLDAKETVENNDVTTQIKDADAFIMGFADGRLSKKNLLSN